MLDLPEPDLHQLQDALANLLAQAVPGAHTELGEEHIVKSYLARAATCLCGNARRAIHPADRVPGARNYRESAAERREGHAAAARARPRRQHRIPVAVGGRENLSYAVNMAVLRYVHSRGAEDAIFMTDNRRNSGGGNLVGADGAYRKRCKDAVHPRTEPRKSCPVPRRALF